MMVPYWVLDGVRPEEGRNPWAPPGVPPPYQQRLPMVSMPFHPSAIVPMINARIIRPPSILRPGPVVYPRHVLFPKSALKQEKGELPDLGNLDRMLNFDLNNILPPNFGFPEIEDERKLKRVGPNNQSGVVEKQTGPRPRPMPLIKMPPHDLGGYMADDFTRNREGDCQEDHDEGPESPRLVIDTEAQDDKQRPQYSYIELIDLAMRHQGEMTVRDIYQWIMDNFEYYRNIEPSKWQPSVRHALTISPAFIKIKKVRGGNLWGHASAREQALARKQKNHWKKQKIAEYVKTSNRRRRKKDDGFNTSSSSMDTNPDFTVSDLNSALTSALEEGRARQEEEEDMEGVEYEEPPRERLNTSKSSGKVSKASSTRSTPAKKAKKSTVQSEEPVAEVIKTHTRHGRVTNKLNYKEFSSRGNKGFFCNPKSVPSRSRSASPNSDTKDNMDDGPDYTSDETNEDGEFEAEMFDADLPERATVPAITNCSKHQTPIDMITPDDSPASTSNTKIFHVGSNITPRNSVTGMIKSFEQTSDHNGTPAHLVVSDLQDFEPTESTDSLLASTSALTSFASTSEAAMILSSLESFPRPSGCDTQTDHTFSIEIMVEKVIEEVEEDPENPLPRPLESSQTISITSSQLKHEPTSDAETKADQVTIEESVTITTAENSSENQDGALQDLPVVSNSQDMASPDTGIVVEIVSPVVGTLRIEDKENAESPRFYFKTESPVQKKTLPSLTLNPTPGSTLLASPREFKNLQAKYHSSPVISSISSPIVKISPVTYTSRSPPLPLVQPCPKVQPQSPLSLPKPQALTSMCLSSSSQPSLYSAPQRIATGPPMQSTAYQYLQPCTLPRPPPLRPCGQNPAYRRASPMQSPRTMSNPAAWAMPNLTRTVFVDIEDTTPQHHLIHQDVSLSDAWRKKTSCKKCCTQVENMPKLTAVRNQQGNAQTRHGLAPRMNAPMRVAGGGSLRSPIFSYGRGLRPVCTASIPYPILHPYTIAPSPVRAEQTAQAVMPTGHSTPRVLSATTRLTPPPAPATATAAMATAATATAATTATATATAATATAATATPAPTATANAARATATATAARATAATNSPAPAPATSALAMATAATGTAATAPAATAATAMATAATAAIATATAARATATIAKANTATAAAATATTQCAIETEPAVTQQVASVGE